MECGRVLLGPMRGAGSCWSTGSAGSSAAAAAAAASASASATGASSRYRMLPLLERTQSSLRRRLRWRESDSREAGMLSSVYWFSVSAAWRWLLLLRHCSRRWVRDGGGCTAAPAGMFALRMTAVMIWGRGGGACSSPEPVGRGKVGISRVLARQRHQGQRTGPSRPPIINDPGGEPKQAGRRRPTGNDVRRRTEMRLCYAGLTQRGEKGHAVHK